MAIKRFSTIAPILDNYFTTLQNSNTDLQVIYDEQQSYETAMAAWRSQYDSNTYSKAPLPLLAYRRRVVTSVPEALRHRSAHSTFVIKDIPNAKGTCIKGFYGRVGVDFTIYSSDTEKLENLEIGYLAEDFMSDIKLGTLDIQDLNLTGIPLQFKYEPLESKQFNIEGTFYMAVSGTFNIDGWFLALEGEQNLIQTLRINTHVDLGVDLTDIADVTANLTTNIEKTIILNVNQ